MSDIDHNIIETAEELFMEYGIKSVSMDDLAAKLGISKKTIYQCVENKRDLIKKSIMSYCRKEKEVVEEISRNSSDALDEQINLARHVISLLRRMKPTLMYDLRKYYPESFRLLENIHFSFIEDVIRNNLIKGIKQGLYRPHLNPVIISKLYVGKTTLLIDEKLFPMRDFNRDQLFKEYIFYHLHGIVSDMGYQRLEELKKIA